MLNSQSCCTLRQEEEKSVRGVSTTASGYGIQCIFPSPLSRRSAVTLTENADVLDSLGC